MAMAAGTGIGMDRERGALRGRGGEGRGVVQRKSSHFTP